MRKIAVLGPESTGKSQLSANLAQILPNAIWVEEFARTYLQKNGSAYSFQTLDIIAAGQLADIEKASEENATYLVVDTEMIVMKIWSEFVFQKVSFFIQQALENQNFDLYLLCDIDLPWEFDPLREHPNSRKELFNLYKKELDALKVPYRIVSGVQEERTQNAIKAIENFYNEPSK